MTVVMDGRHLTRNANLTPLCNLRAPARVTWGKGGHFQEGKREFQFSQPSTRGVETRVPFSKWDGGSVKHRSAHGQRRTGVFGRPGSNPTSVVDSFRDPERLAESHLPLFLEKGDSNLFERFILRACGMVWKNSKEVAELMFYSKNDQKKKKNSNLDHIAIF